MNQENERLMEEYERLASDVSKFKHFLETNIYGMNLLIQMLKNKMLEVESVFKSKIFYFIYCVMK